MRVEAVQRSARRPFAKKRQRAEVVGDESQVAIELRNTAWRCSVGCAHLRDQKAALRQREEIVGDAGLDGSGRKQKPRLSFVGDIEEEDPVLAFEEAQQSATTQDLLIDGKVAVMRLV